MKLRHLLIATGVIAVWSASARGVAAYMTEEPISKLDFSDWAIAYALALWCGLVIAIGIGVVIALTALIDDLLANNDDS